MNKQKDSKHISLWIPNSLYKECNIYQIRHGIKTRSEYVKNALEFYNVYLSREESTDYINKQILNRMEEMLDSLENRIGRQMFKLIVESAKICRILFDGLELDMDDFDALHEQCIKEAKHLNGAITFPSSMRGKKLAELYEEE
ncbi:MAG: hypothetical protein E7393_02650 [Ruminococcaceae bacterium]|nr:hypothetical protein [Oscillospiraceae bacterium]